MQAVSIAIALSLAAYSSPPRAVQQIPRFDIKASCDKAIELPGCVEMEHAALGALTFWWKKVRNPHAKAFCIAEVSQAPFLHYSRLMSCIAVQVHLPRSQLATIMISSFPDFT